MTASEPTISRSVSTRRRSTAAPASGGHRSGDWPTPTSSGDPASTPRTTECDGDRSDLPDLPGVTRREQLPDVSRPAVGDRPLLLIQQDVLVDRRLDTHEDADGDRELVARHAGQHQGGAHVLAVVDPERALGNVLHPHDLRPHPFQDEAAPVVDRAEDEWL